MLILVRHAVPAHGPDTPPHEWRLGEDGRGAAEELVRQLPADAHLVASTEPKAAETLAPAGPVITDRRFNEVSRVEAFSDDFSVLRRAYVEGADLPDWEPRDEVAQRFDDGVSAQISAADGHPLVVASHGMAMTLWLTARIGLGDPGRFWADLRFPDMHMVDLVAGTVARIRPGSARSASR
jgi:broad specificity phosphatase PhoE